MCGRFTLQVPAELLAEVFDLWHPPELPPRYNIAPTQQVAVIRQDDRGHNRLDSLRWGLIPFWAKDPGIGSKMINARSESIDQKPAFRSSLRHRRCLVPASGFFEWETVAGKKVPRYLRLKGGGPMVFAGLWDCWQAPDGSRLESCTILTTAANSFVAPLHDRMPVILDRPDFARWLDRRLTDPARLKELLRPLPSDRMEGWVVSTLANSPRNDLPDLIVPVASEGESLAPLLPFG